jgi:hypothetical protein
VHEHGSQLDSGGDARAGDRAASRAADRAAGREAWRAARTFGELCALGAAFLERRCAYFPGWGAPEPDDETDAIRAPLLALHARGLLSVASQPAFDGRRAGRAVRQRAFVAGFAHVELAQRLLRESDVVVRAWHADGTSNVGGATIEPEPMTLEGGVARVVSGHAARADELALFGDEIGAGALRELGTTTYVTAWDPEFGRTELLWETCVRLAAG